MANIQFTCPKCGGNGIEEIQVNITVASDIAQLWRDGDGIVQTDYGEQTNDDGDGGHVDRYQCGCCGYTIVDDKSCHAEDGLDEASLAAAIEELNAGRKNAGRKAKTREVEMAVCFGNGTWEACQFVTIPADTSDDQIEAVARTALLANIKGDVAGCFLYNSQDDECPE